LFPSFVDDEEKVKLTRSQTTTETMAPSSKKEAAQEVLEDEEEEAHTSEPSTTSKEDPAHAGTMTREEADQNQTGDPKSDKSEKSKSSKQSDKSEKAKSRQSEKSEKTDEPVSPKAPMHSSSNDKSQKTPKSQGGKTKLGDVHLTTPKPKTSKIMSPRPASSRKTRKAKRGITFKKTVGVNIIPNLDTYNQEEKSLTWFGPDEYAGMEDECDLTSGFMDRNKPLWPGYCGRGLEAWTTQGEQIKERHVQLAVDIVWNAQLEQWKASSDTNGCWEFIRSRYMQVSKPCHHRANKIGLADEAEVRSYLSGVRSVEKNRRRMLGIHERGGEGVVKKAGRTIRRTTSEQTPKTSRKQIGRNYSEKSPSKSSPKSALKGLSSDSEDETIDDESYKKTPKAGSRIKSSKSKKASDESPSKQPRKIVFKPRSKSKIPLSPVSSMCSAADSDVGSTVSRRMRSHMSVCTDDSSRRRMLRTANIKKL
jgi:hypothetical protein